MHAKEMGWKKCRLDSLVLEYRPVVFSNAHDNEHLIFIKCRTFDYLTGCPVFESKEKYSYRISKKEPTAQRLSFTASQI